MITTLFHAASTTKSTHDHIQLSFFASHLARTSPHCRVQSS